MPLGRYMYYNVISTSNYCPVSIFDEVISRQREGAHPTLAYGWPTVCDTGPALSQHGVSVVLAGLK